MGRKPFLRPGRLTSGFAGGKGICRRGTEPHRGLWVPVSRSQNSLAEFYNRVESTSERYVRYNVVTEEAILPLLSQGPEAFYDPVTGDLRSRYQVHMDQLRTLRDEVSFIVDRADTLHLCVLAELERLR